MMLSHRVISKGANDARRLDLMTEAVGQGFGFVEDELPVERVVPRGSPRGLGRSCAAACVD